MQIRYRGIANLLVEKTIVTQNRCKTLRFSIFKRLLLLLSLLDLERKSFLDGIDKQKQCLIQQNHIRIYQFFLRSIANLLDRSVGPKESKALKFKTILYNHPFCLLRANAYHIVDWNSLFVV